VPAFVAADESHTPLLQACRARGGSLLLKGAGAGALPDEVLGCFDYVLIEPGGIAPLAAPRPLRIVSAGAESLSEVDEAFTGGATAVLGWPLQAEIYGAGAPRPAPPDLQVIVELMKRVDREEPIDRLEAVLKNDASLAFRLVRYINSAAFGLRVEISSFRHAIMLLGYHKLKRWLALLLASAGRGPNVKPVLSTAVLRGLLMEELVRSSGDEQERSEMFICGVFSLLDCLLAQPFDVLMKSIPVPQDVVDALASGSGPYRPFLDVVRAVEQESLFDIRDASQSLLLSAAEVNRALLRALAAARQLT
jgi:EAL and modified HD-GYP domain-containing signal transduction protein